MPNDDVILQLTGEEGGVGRIVREGSSAIVHRGDGETVDVAAPDDLSLIREHAGDLLGEEVVSEARSEALAAKPLADVLAETLGDEHLPEEELWINGVLLQPVHDEVQERPTWWPEVAGTTAGVELILAAHWDLLAGKPSPASGGPGELQVHRYKDQFRLVDPGIEMDEVRHADNPLTAIAPAADALVSHPVTHIASPWLHEAGADTTAALLESGTSPVSARCVFVNGALWWRSGQSWQAAPIPREASDPVLQGLAHRLALRTLTLDRWAPRSDDPPLELLPDATVTDDEGAEEHHHLLVLAGAEPAEDLIAMVLEAALKSSEETFPVRIARLELDDGSTRFGVTAAATQVDHLCERLALPGWMTLPHGDHGGQLRWTSRDGTTSVLGVQARPGARPVTPFEDVVLDGASHGLDGASHGLDG